jgi:hypothetical protein
MPHPGHFTLGKETWHKLHRGLVGPQGKSGQVQKIPSPPLGFSPKTIKPVASCCSDYTWEIVSDMDAKNSWYLVPCSSWGRLLISWGFWSRILHLTDTGIAVFIGFEICDTNLNDYANLKFCPYLQALDNKFKIPPQLWELVLLDSSCVCRVLICSYILMEGVTWTDAQQASFIWDHVCGFHSSG